MRALLLIFIALSACKAEQSAPAPQRASACSEQRFEGSSFTVCAVRQGTVEIRSGVRDFPALEAKLGKRAANVAFAMNAGMFDDSGAAIGLMIEEGKRLHAINRREGGGNFHLLPNGVFAVDSSGRAQVMTSASFKSGDPVTFATQSGPMLVIDGKLHPDFSHDGESRYVRNGVGIAPDGTPMFVISVDAVSLGKFARFFRDQLNTANALYLDGSVSSLWDPSNARMDNFTELGPLLVVFRPQERVRTP